MVEIRPFKALMYDWEEVDGEPAAVTSPPYDVLSAEDVARLKKTSNHNVTHLTLPEPLPGKEPESRYTEAARILKTWRKDGILHQSQHTSYFVYDETYSVGPERRTARGIVGLLRLDADYRHVHPHEKTHKGPIADRLDLLRATATDLEPIQLIYKDRSSEINTLIAAAIKDQAPVVAFQDPAGTEHKVWAITAPDAVETIQAAFSRRDVYISDGHHRYATALTYAAERRAAERNPEGAQPYDYKLAVFVNADDPGLSVFPTHRLIHGLADAKAARKRLHEKFGTERLMVAGTVKERAAALAAKTAEVDRAKAYRFVFYWGGGETDVLTLPTGRLDLAALGAHSDAWKRLDVVVLHHLVLPTTLGVDDRNAGEHLRYTRIDSEAVETVDRGKNQVAVFMNATPLAAVTAIADAREHMPQKSTYFQPKLQSGLVFAPLK